VKPIYQIVLVEDNPADVYLFQKALEGAEVNCQITVLSDGGQAMAFAGTSATSDALPDLIILDLNQPRNGGVEILQPFEITTRWPRFGWSSLVLRARHAINSALNNWGLIAIFQSLLTWKIFWNLVSSLKTFWRDLSLKAWSGIVKGNHLWDGSRPLASFPAVRAGIGSIAKFVFDAFLKGHLLKDP
jgi:hypothetical protein